MFKISSAISKIRNVTTSVENGQDDLPVGSASIADNLGKSSLTFLIMALVVHPGASHTSILKAGQE